MLFTGTQQKCRVCEKTVYPIELLSADGVPFHKSCFKCSHCKSTLQKMLRRESSNKQSGGHSLVLMLLVGLLACVNIGYILNGRT